MSVIEITEDLRFEFDVRGYLHLRQVMSQEEVAQTLAWAEEAGRVDVKEINKDYPEGMKRQVNRPVSRIIDADPRFARFLDYPAMEALLKEFLGPDYKHIDNELYYTYPGYKGGGWHRGVKTHSTGYVVEGRFICPMIKLFYCLTDVVPGQGEFEVVPGSHRAHFTILMKERLDLPGQHLFNDVKAGDVILFNEGLLHNGRPNTTDRTRKTVIINLGRSEAGVWEGYRPLPRTMDAVTPRQREILSNTTTTYWS